MTALYTGGVHPREFSLHVLIIGTHVYSSSYYCLTREEPRLGSSAGSSAQTTMPQERGYVSCGLSVAGGFNLPRPPSSAALFKKGERGVPKSPSVCRVEAPLGVRLVRWRRLPGLRLRLVDRTVKRRGLKAISSSTCTEESQGVRWHYYNRPTRSIELDGITVIGEA